MGYYMEKRIYPEQTAITLYEIIHRGKQQPRTFLLGKCIGTGAGCVAYQAAEENGIPVRLKQYRPVGMDQQSSLYRLSEDRFLNAYRQQVEMMQDEKTAAVTAGLIGLYRDEDGWYWTSVNSMVGKTLDRLLPENSLHKNIEIFSRLAESIRAYHEAGWLLLDVKPTNILVIDSLGLRGINFFDFDSFVRVQDIQDALREHRQILLSSSENYSAPELLESTVNLEEIGPAADFYSLGAILFEGLFGRAPELYDCIPGSTFILDNIKAADGRALTESAKMAISAFFQHTLTLSPETRFSTDAELEAALNRILQLTESMGPELLRRMPGAVRDFYGRELELGELCGLLRETDEPIYLYGMAGVGKTQLALRAASELSPEYDCYYASFQGTVRKTLLSLPFEGLEREKTGEDGATIPKTDEELWQEILPVLKHRDRGRSLLIIDNFDAPNDEDTPALRYDPNLAELEALPFRLVFTTRCRFNGVRSLCVENLENNAALQMLHDAMPEDAEEDLNKLAEAVGRHTLTLRILTDTVRESKGKIRSAQLLEMLAGSRTSADKDPVAARLRAVFRAADMSKTARSVLACATLFPQAGLSSDLLLRLFSKEQWAAASQLERCGWLRFDPVGGLWTIHPIVRLICQTEKQTRTEWDNVGSFVTALRKTNNDGSFDQAGPDEKAQLEELFAALGKLNLRRKPKPALLVGVAAVLVAILALVLWGSREKDDSPVAHLKLTPQAFVTDEIRRHDSSIVLERLLNIGAHDAAMDAETGVITATLRASFFDGAGDKYVAAGALSAYPGNLCVIGTTGFNNTFLEIDRENILDVHMEYGSIPGLSREKRKEVGLGESTEYAWITLTVDAETQKKILSLVDTYEKIHFTTDFDPEHPILPGHAGFGAVPGKDENTWYMVDGAWCQKNLCTAFVELFKMDPLEKEYDFELKLEPAAMWQDPESLPQEVLGKNQCRIDDLSGDLAVMFYRPSFTSNGDSISDAVFQEILNSFRNRLDCFGLPYALGTGFYKEREIAVCISTKRLNREIAVGVLPTNRLLIRSSAKPRTDLIIDTDDIFWKYLYAEVVKLENGTYGLQLSAPDAAYLEIQFEEAQKDILKAGGGELYLCAGGSSYQHLAAKVDPEENETKENSVDHRCIVFTSSPLFGIEQFGENEEFLLSLFAELINTGAELTTDISVSYNLATHPSYTTTDAEFGFNAVQSDEHDQQIIEEMKEIEAYLDSFLDGFAENGLDVFDSEEDS